MWSLKDIFNIGYFKHSSVLFLYFFAASGKQRPPELSNLSRACLYRSWPQICRLLNVRDESENGARAEFSNWELHQQSVLTHRK